MFFELLMSSVFSNSRAQSSPADDSYPIANAPYNGGGVAVRRLFTFDEFRFSLRRALEYLPKEMLHNGVRRNLTPWRISPHPFLCGSPLHKAQVDSHLKFLKPVPPPQRFSDVAAS